MNLFWEKGYNATSMQNLVETMGINRGSMYNTYGDKYVLFLETLREFTKKSILEAQESIIKSYSPLNALEKVVERVVNNSLEDQKGKACMVVKSTFELAADNPEVKKIAQRSAKDLINIYQKLIEEAQERGEIKKNRDAKSLAQYFYASLSSIRFMSILFRDRETLENIEDGILHVLKA